MTQPPLPWKVSSFAINTVLRLRYAGMSGTSTHARWFDAIMNGPSVGRFWRPTRRTRKKIVKKRRTTKRIARQSIIGVSYGSYRFFWGFVFGDFAGFSDSSGRRGCSELSEG